jgi:pantoate--beta-alanine ligase
MQLVTDPNTLAPLRGGVLVPTMGALHVGHEALIRDAISLRDRDGLASVIVSVFVNPAQFDEQRDFDAYPRTLDDDAATCEHLGVDAVFAPTVDAVYPGGAAGRELQRPLPLPEVVVNKGLEDRYRPGHFEGVYRVCRRLFELVRPAAATFGEKDWQQLKLNEAMSQQEGLGVRVVGTPTVREGPPRAGLALSSRNVHLTPADRGAAVSLIQAIRAAQHLGQQGAGPAACEDEARRIMFASGARVEYAAVRDAQTCGPVQCERPARVLVAARVGATRLIDNDAWPS